MSIEGTGVTDRRTARDRRPARLVGLVVLACAVIGALIVPVRPAHALSIADPDVFGRGEAWPTPAQIRPGDRGPWVVHLQRSLAALGFRPGSADGVYGAHLLGAVYAFQKYHGLPRDGIFRDEYWQLLDGDPATIGHATAADRVEIDLDRQLLFLVEDGTLTAVLPISSANGERYRSSSGRYVNARTPEGAFTFYRRVDGWRISYLGALYRPVYFRGGYAIHGSRSVPPWPASHGCIRVQMWDMDWLAPRVHLGMPIYIYGKDRSRDEVIPAVDVDGREAPTVVDARVPSHEGDATASRL